MSYVRSLGSLFGATYTYRFLQNASFWEWTHCFPWCLSIFREKLLSWIPYIHEDWFSSSNAFNCSCYLSYVSTPNILSDYRPWMSPVLDFTHFLLSCTKIHQISRETKAWSRIFSTTNWCWSWPQTRVRITLISPLLPTISISLAFGE